MNAPPYKLAISVDLKRVCRGFIFFAGLRFMSSSFEPSKGVFMVLYLVSFHGGADLGFVTEHKIDLRQMILDFKSQWKNRVLCLVLEKQEPFSHEINLDSATTESWILLVRNVSGERVNAVAQLPRRGNFSKHSVY